jgi:hypothetical protein
MRAIFKFQFIVAVLVMGISCGGKKRPDELILVQQIQHLRELTTVRYSLQRVVGLREPKLPFGEESILLMVEGNASAGINLGAVTRESIRYTGPDTVQVELPAAKLLDVSLDEKKTRVWDRQVTWWTPWVPFSPDLEHRARVRAVDDVRQAALRMGILQQADRDAETAIRELLGAFGIKADMRKLSS